MSGARIPKRVARYGERRRGHRLPAELREEIGDYSRRRSAQGVGVREIAAEVGVSTESVRRWSATPEEDTVALPVHVQPDDASDGIVVVTPSGVRVEGLDIE